MSHLGERASALIDGELGHAERERALAHLTFCADCRAELDSIRALKSRLRSLDPPAVPADLTMSLLRMSEPGGPIPPRVRPFPSTTYSMTSPSDNRPRRGGGFSGPGRSQGGRRAGYVAVGVASAAVALGTLFMVGGTGDRPTSPPVEMFANQHRTTPPAGQLVPGRMGTPARQP
ncbi:zf-HC2 domain-containing protein [Sphaerisporangium album]|uniref:Zf-HC2 domain-containing protein n=1 Tax=Sphaerisporangium album TaxID=509200 RepID=A0A367EN87_9ACTN|nr:anti-sigma factor [Sphaerisporangium album]RCG18670.1 zf-HC2 domain-containing protein [Sphaerisporangium album]